MDDAAVAKELDRCRPLMIACAKRFRPYDDVEEIVQDACVRAWQARASAKDRNMSGWLGRIVRNICIDRLRYEKTRTAINAPIPEIVADPFSMEKQFERRESIEIAMQVPQAKYVIDWLASGLSAKEYAQVAGVHHGSVRTWLYRLREHLKAEGLTCE